MSRVLIIDDVAEVLRAWRTPLRRCGHEVLCAESVSSARTLLEERRFDIVLLDLHLPEEDGEALLPCLAKLDTRPAVAVVSAYLDARRAVELQSCGVLVVPKPVDGPSLCALVAELAGSRPDVVELFAAEAHLSPRETALLRLCFSGVTPEEMPERLGCTESTVRTYWHRVQQKTRLGSRAEVMAALARFAAGRPRLLRSTTGRQNDSHAPILGGGGRS